METMPMIWQAPERFRTHLGDVTRWFRLNEAEIENTLTQGGVLVIRGFKQLTNQNDFDMVIAGFSLLKLTNRHAYFFLEPVEETIFEPSKIKLKLQPSDILIIDQRFIANHPKRLLCNALIGLMSPQLEF